MLEHLFMSEEKMEKIIEHTKALGFDLIGFSDVKIPRRDAEIYKNWLDEKYHGDMKYMENSSPRLDLQKILPGAKTVISLAVNYYKEQEPLKNGFGRIARYANSRDYHKVIGKKLKQLEEFIKTLNPNAKTKSYVDTGPILERSFAQQAGLGVIGKNTCLITKEFGSWVFLGEIITNLEVLPGKNFQKKAQTAQLFQGSNTNFPLCGSCTRCIDSCPARAIVAPGVIDARRCISYLTIENKKPIPKKFHKAIKSSKYLFGCDICQEVCPHNCRAKSVNLQARNETKCHFPSQLSLKKILQIKSDKEFLNLFAGTPLMRAKRSGLQRTAKILKQPSSPPPRRR